MFSRSLKVIVFSSRVFTFRSQLEGNTGQEVVCPGRRLEGRSAGRSAAWPVARCVQVFDGGMNKQLKEVKEVRAVEVVTSASF